MEDDLDEALFAGFDDLEDDGMELGAHAGSIGPNAKARGGKVTGAGRKKSTPTRQTPQTTKPSSKAATKRKVNRQQDEDGATEADDVEGEEHKKCNQCKKKRKLSDFRQKKNDCVNCLRDTYGFEKLCEAQRLTEWHDELKANQPKAYALAVANYAKLCPWRGARKSRGSYNISETNEFTSTTGHREEGRSKMMWEREYSEWAQTTPAGNLSEVEYKANWKKWFDDKNHKRDHAGPRGFLRLSIPNVESWDVDYKDAAEMARIVLEGRKKKSATAAELRAGVARTMAGHGDLFQLEADDVPDDADDHERFQPAIDVMTQKSKRVGGVDFSSQGDGGWRPGTGHDDGRTRGP
jgi:hypothetical protein